MLQLWFWGHVYTNALATPAWAEPESRSPQGPPRNPGRIYMMFLSSTLGCLHFAQTFPALYVKNAEWRISCFLSSWLFLGCSCFSWAKSATSSFPHIVLMFFLWNNYFFTFNIFSCHRLLSELLVIPQNQVQISPYLYIFVRFSKSIVNFPTSDLIVFSSCLCSHPYYIFWLAYLFTYLPPY